MFGSLNSMETEIKTINAPMKKDFCLKEKIAKFVTINWSGKSTYKKYCFWK